MPAVQQITLTAGGISRSATTSPTASSRIFDDDWTTPEPKPTLAEGPDGSRAVDADAYEDRPISISVDAETGSPVAADDWVSAWQEIAAAASADEAAALTSTFPNGLTLTFEVLSAQFKDKRGHEHFHGYASGELVLKARPFGAVPEVEIAGTRTVRDGVTFWKADQPLAGDVPALLRVAASNTGRWTVPPMLNRFAIGGDFEDAVWETVGAGTTVFMPPVGSPPPGARTASTTIRVGQAQAGVVVPMLRSTYVPAGRWLIGFRATALPPYANSGSDTYPALADFAIAIDGEIVTPWQQAPGRRSTTSPPSTWWEDAEIWRYLEFAVSVPRAGARVEVVIRATQQQRFIAGLTPVYMNIPRLMSASGGTATVGLSSPEQMRGADITTFQGPCAGNSVSVIQSAFSGGTTPIADPLVMMLGTLTDVSGTWATASSVSTPAVPGTEGINGRGIITASKFTAPSTYSAATLNSAGYNELSLDLQFPSADVAGGAPYSSIGYPGGGVSIGMAANQAEAGNALSSGCWEGPAVDVGPRMLGVGAHRSDRSLASWRLVDPGLVGDAWYTLKLVWDALGRWWVYLAPSGMRPVLVADGEAKVSGSVTAAAATVMLHPSNISGQSPKVRSLTLAIAQTAQTASTPTTWGADGDGARGPRPKAAPRTRPTVAFRRIDCAAADRTDADWGDASTGNAMNVYATARYLQVPRG